MFKPVSDRYLIAWLVVADLRKILPVTDRHRARRVLEPWLERQSGSRHEDKHEAMHGAIP